MPARLPTDAQLHKLADKVPPVFDDELMARLGSCQGIPLQNLNGHLHRLRARKNAGFSDGSPAITTALNGLRTFLAETPELQHLLDKIAPPPRPKRVKAVADTRKAR
ncbi:MAG: hypothetical protein H6922_02290 [Pseudomonadaceae bacterium]|nr:hypothetical protein [Pseudomonadaceae bacterium]